MSIPQYFLIFCATMVIIAVIVMFKATKNWYAYLCILECLSILGGASYLVWYLGYA